MRERSGHGSRPRGPARPGGVGARRPVSPAPSSVTRPAGRRPAGGPATVVRTTARPQRRLTIRAVVLAVVLVALALSYVFPLRTYLNERAEIAQRRAALAEQEAHVEQLAEQAARWRDENYLRMQARMRLYYGEPGELLLAVVWEDEYVPPETGFDPDQVPSPPGTWWETLWTSIQSAAAEPEPDEAPELAPEPAAEDEQDSAEEGER